MTTSVDFSSPGTGTFDVTITADSDVELDETFYIMLSGATGGLTLGATCAKGTIIDDDPVVVSGVTFNRTTTTGSTASATVLEYTQSSTGPLTVAYYDLVFDFSDDDTIRENQLVLRVRGSAGAGVKGVARTDSVCSVSGFPRRVSSDLLVTVGSAGGWSSPPSEAQLAAGYTLSDYPSKSSQTLAFRLGVCPDTVDDGASEVYKVEILNTVSRVLATFDLTVTDDDGATVPPGTAGPAASWTGQPIRAGDRIVVTEGTDTGGGADSNARVGPFQNLVVTPAADAAAWVELEFAQTVSGSRIKWFDSRLSTFCQTAGSGGAVLRDDWWVLHGASSSVDPGSRQGRGGRRLVGHSADGAVRRHRRRRRPGDQRPSLQPGRHAGHILDAGPVLDVCYRRR